MKHVVLLLVASLVAFDAMAGDSVPLVNHESVPVVTGSGKPASLQAVGVAIANAAAHGKRVWAVKRTAPDKLRATYHVRQYAISVDVDYSAKAYSIRYAASEYMKYGEVKGQKVIDSFYNNWVDELKRGINAELSKL